MLIGYNTNGLAHHDGLQAIEVLADIGYQSIAITVDHQLLSPKSSLSNAQKESIRRLISDRGLRTVIESGARFLLDPHKKHHPTLISSDRRERQRRIGFNSYCIELAADLKSDCVSLWSGIQPAGQSDDESMELLAQGLDELLVNAKSSGVCLAFEPEPDMFIDTMAQFTRLLQILGRDDLKLTLDVGHLFCQGEIPIAEQVFRWRELIRNVHIEDMKPGIHQHLFFGDGEIHFPPVIDSLQQIGYQGGVHVELSRHSHEGPQIARRAFEFLQPLIQKAGSS